MKTLIIFMLSVLFSITPEKSIVNDIKNEYSHSTVVKIITPSENLILDDLFERMILNFRFELRLGKIHLKEKYENGEISEEKYQENITQLINICNEKIYVVNQMRSNNIFSQQFTKGYFASFVDTNNNEIVMDYILNENNEIFGVLTYDMQNGLFALTPEAFSKRHDKDFFENNKDLFYVF